MLGRHHASISVGTVLPFVVPLVFLDNQIFLEYSIALVVAVLIGSLIPDADCGGKSKLYYDFQIVYFLMIPLTQIVVRTFRLFDLKNKYSLEHEVTEEHRGIMHAPIGIAISSIYLAIVLSIFLIWAKEFNIIFIMLIFFGLFIGQFLHSLEDSFTVSGINWKFPYGTKELKGKIYTFEKIKDKVDIRPMLYQYCFGAVSVLLVLGYALNKMTSSPP